MPNFKKDKQVRFAYDLNKFHPARVPALHLAPSTTSSNTPPLPSRPLPRSYNRRHFSPSSPRLHPLLDASGVSWNMLDNFSTITRHNQLPNRVLYEQATTPPVPFLSIASLHLPWFIDVYASNGSYVSVGDVFSSIYWSLRTNITTSEFHCFPRQRDQVRATRAYEQRYRRFRNIYGHDAEKRAGMKRIDFLMSHTRFQGISHSGNSDQWQLCPTT